MKALPLLLPLLLLLGACRHDEVIIEPEREPIISEADLAGFYLLNEGNMGSNKCTLDFCDLQSGEYERNIYSDRNPSAVKELGDVGNDIGIYGSKMWMVINCSHKVEVVDARTARRLGQVDIPNCRYVRFHEGKAYVSSYVGPVKIDKNCPLGAVFEVDTTSLQITRRVDVGYQPEEFEFVGDFMYVANSGGYMAPDYETTVSVVRLSDFTEVMKIPVAINLWRLRKDSRDMLWISSRGNDLDIPSRIYMLNPYTREVSGPIADVPCNNMAIRSDSLYFISSSADKVYGIINTRTGQLVSSNFITDGTESNIRMPYGLALNPANGDVYLTDARNYVSSGRVHCYTKDGVLKWTATTGDIPSAMAFLRR